MTAIFIAATIVVFLIIDWIVQRVRSRASQADMGASVPGNGGYPLRIPAGIYFSKSHTWISLFPSGEARIGIDDFIGSVLGDPEVTFMRGLGERVKKGDPLIVLSTGDRRLVIRAPLAGEIVRVNDNLEKHPQAMRDQLFSEGWAYTLRPNMLDELRSLMLGEESRNWMRRLAPIARSFCRQSYKWSFGAGFSAGWRLSGCGRAEAPRRCCLAAV
jgi:glycine cleavage system H protein